MDVVAKQHVVIKYCIRRNKTAIETLSELKEAYRNEIQLGWRSDANGAHLFLFTSCSRLWEYYHSQMAGEARMMHWGSYFEKTSSEKIDVETDVSDSE